MNQTDARKLTDAIKELTKELQGRGRGPGGTPTPNIPTPAEPTGSDPVSVKEAEIAAIKEKLKIEQAAASWKEASDADRLTRLVELKDLEADSVELTKEQRAELEALIPFQLGYTDAIEDAVKASKELNKELKNEERQRRRLIREQRDLNELKEEQYELERDTHDVIKDTFKSIVQTSKLKPDPKRGVAGFLRAVIQNSEAREEALDTFHNQIANFKSLLTPTNLLATAFEGLASALMSAVTLGFGAVIRAIQAAVELVVGAVLKFDALGASIAKTTGHGREFAQETVNLATNTRGATATLETMTPAVVSLGNQLRNVNGISYETAASFAAVAVSAERMGVSVEETGLFMRDAMVGGQMSAEEAESAFSNLNKAAELMGRNFSELSGEFMSSRATFAAYGQNMQKVFLRTSSVARQMGVELGTVLGMSDKFKTFEDSAGFVAEFNHMVGASLDPLEMMRLRAEEGPEAVAMALKDSINMTGKSFDELSFAMKEGIADSLGIPMNELRNMMESDVDLGLVDDIESAAQPVDTLIDKGNATLTVLERIGSMLMQVAEQFAIAFGFDEFAGKGLSGLLDEMQDFISTDLRGTIMNDFVPFVKVDLPQILKTLGALVKSMTESDMLRFVLGMDSKEEAAAKAAQAESDKVIGKAENIDALFSYMNTEAGKSKGDAFYTEQLKGLMGDDYDPSKTLQENAKQAHKFAKEVFAGRHHAVKAAKEAQMADFTSFKTIGSIFADAATHGPAQFSDFKNQAKARAPNLMGTNGFLRDGIAYVHKGERIQPEVFARNGPPYSDPANTQSPPETKVAVSINVDDRKLRDLFNVTVEKVIEGA